MIRITINVFKHSKNIYNTFKMRREIRHGFRIPPVSLLQTNLFLHYCNLLVIGDILYILYRLRPFFTSLLYYFPTSHLERRINHSKQVCPFVSLCVCKL